MTEPLSQSVIEAGEEEYSRVLIELGTEQDAMIAAYRAMQAADPDWVEMRTLLKQFGAGSIDVSGSAVILGYPEAKEALAKVRDLVARTANETGKGE